MVKWSSELDQVFLLKILEVCEIKPTAKHYETMVTSWPEHLERPTARALSEHLFSLRKTARATIAKGGKGDKGDSSSPEKSTPKKNAEKAAGAEGTPKKTPSKTPTKEKGKPGPKRKRAAEEDNNEYDGVVLAPKSENPDDACDEGGDFPLPKKSRAATMTEDKALQYDGSFDNPIKLEAW